MISSPTSNLFELLQDEANPKRKANPNKPAGKNQLSTADQQRKRQEEEDQKKIDAALASQHQEEAVAEGFVVAQTTSSNKQNTRLSRLECMSFVRLKKCSCSFCSRCRGRQESQG